MEAVRVRVRYHSPDANGVTRAQRNAIAQYKIPSVWVPRVGLQYWDALWSVSSHRTDGGRLSPVVLQTWLDQHGLSWEPWEFRLFEAMDAVLVKTLADEIENNRQRMTPRG